MTSGTSWRRIHRGYWPAWLIAGFLVCAGLVVYANAVRHPFVHDDIVFIEKNPSIARWDNIADVFLKPGEAFRSLKISIPYYRPVLEVFYRLEYFFFGRSPAGFHFFNILVHILNAILVYLLALNWRVRRPWALMIATVFLLHPVQSEAVACVSGISNLVVTSFLLMSFLCYMRAGRGGVYFAGAMVFFLAALFTKEQAVVFPLLVVLYEGCAAGTGGRKRPAVFLRIAVLFAMTVGYLVWRSHLVPGFLGAALENPGELWLRLLAIPGEILMYAGTILMPVGLHYYRSTDILAPAVLPIVSFVAVNVGIAVMLGKMPRRLRFLAIMGLAWFLIGLLPMLNIVPFITEYSFILTAEHFVYVSMIGFLLFLTVAGTWAFHRPWRTLDRAVRLIIVMALVILLATATVRQNTFWRGDVALFERTLEFEPRLGRVHLLLAKAYAARGRFSEALDHYTTSLNIMEDYAKKSEHSRARTVYRQYVKVIRSDRGQALMFLGQPERSNGEYKAALAVRLEGLAAAESEVSDTEIANDIGLNNVTLGRRDEARRYFQLAVMIDPGNSGAFNNLGMSYLNKGDRRLAKIFFRRALAGAPGFMTAGVNLRQMQENP